MNRSAKVLVALGLVLSACGAGSTATSIQGAGDPPTTTELARPITETTSVVTADPAVSPLDRAPSGVEGPVAPDFSLVLADGSTFTLSEGSRPVYMVFWAEW